MPPTQNISPAIYAPPAKLWDAILSRLLDRDPLRGRARGATAIWGYSEAISNGRQFRMEGYYECKDVPKRKLIFAEVTTNCGNFCCKGSCKGSEGVEPLRWGLVPESLKATFWSYGAFKGRLGSRKPWIDILKVLGLYGEDWLQKASKRHLHGFSA